MIQEIVQAGDEFVEVAEGGGLRRIRTTGAAAPFLDSSWRRRRSAARCGGNCAAIAAPMTTSYGVATMAEISASMVMELRQRTGLGMMECKKALTESAGDLAKAEDLLRIKSGAKASKAAGRVAAEGVIGLFVGTGREDRRDGRSQLRDRLRRQNDDFLAFATELAADRRARQSRPTSPRSPALRARVGRDGRGAARRAGAEDRREHARSAASCASRRRAVSPPTCTATKIGVLVDVDGGDDALGKDVAMHIAAMQAGRRRRKSGVPADVVEKERAIAAAQAAEVGQARRHRRQDGRRRGQQVPGGSHAAGPALRQGRRKQTVEQLLEGAEARR